MHVLFVCTGNSCRSPMCEAYFRHLCEEAGRDDIEVSSAGVFAENGGGASPKAIEILKEYGADLKGHRSSALTEERIDNADIIITMAEAHRQHIGSKRPKALHKTHNLMKFVSKEKMDVVDPFGGDLGTYGFCFGEMKPALDNLFLDIDKIVSGK